jgi:6,7-dimethyl-8-ribityllumazine synthase
VLTVETVEQALERAATTVGNKGGESMDTALEMIALMAQL